MTVRRTRLRVNSTTSNWYPATSRRWCTSSRRTLRTPGWWLATTRVSSRRPRVPARPARPSRCRSASPACPNRSPRESPSRAPVSVSRCPPRVDAARGAWTRGSAGPACRARVWDVAHRPWRRLRRGVWAVVWAVRGANDPGRIPPKLGTNGRFSSDELETHLWAMSRAMSYRSPRAADARVTTNPSSGSPFPRLGYGSYVVGRVGLDCQTDNFLAMLSEQKVGRGQNRHLLLHFPD